MGYRFTAVLLLFFSVAALYAADATREQAADGAAQQWLSLTDSGKSGESWDAASTGFKSHVTRPQWQQAMQSVRTPLGDVVSRALQSAKYTHQLPGAPDADYVVIQYTTSFANKKQSVETVVMELDGGAWKTSGYFIK